MCTGQEQEEPALGERLQQAGGAIKKQSLPVQRACRDCAGVADRWGPPERPWPGEGALGKNAVREALNRCPRPGSR